MTTDRWSPADLSKQRVVVSRLAQRAELNRRRWIESRHAATTRVRTLARSPWVLGASFALGWLVVRPASRRRGATVAARLSLRLRRAGASLLWLAHLYRQFQRGLAAGAALTAGPRPAEPPGQGLEER
jgi:hypothetical protein